MPAKLAVSSRHYRVEKLIQFSVANSVDKEKNEDIGTISP